MSILIKDMEMPKCCAECEWHEYYGGDYDWVHACRRTGTMPLENAETERANDCPLIEIPTPHGRLIDADALINELASVHVGGLEAIKIYTGADTWTSGLHTAWRTIDDADTVIEAEGTEWTNTIS